MRVVLKPGGILTILGAILALIALAYAGWQKAQTMELFANGGKPTLGENATSFGIVRAPKQGELITPDMQEWSMVVHRPGKAVMSNFVVPNAPWQGDNHAMRIKISSVRSEEGIAAVPLVKEIPVAVASGTTVAIELWARSETSNAMQVALKTGTEPAIDEFTQEEILSPTWKKFSYSAKIKKDYGVAALGFSLRIGKNPGQVEIAQVKVSAH